MTPAGKFGCLVNGTRFEYFSSWDLLCLYPRCRTRFVPFGSPPFKQSIEDSLHSQNQNRVIFVPFGPLNK